MFNLSALPTIISGILAVISYGFFSKHYEPLTRKTKNSLLPPALLYGWAAVILFITSAVIALFFGPHFDLPTTVTVFGFHFLKHPEVLVVFFVMIVCPSFITKALSKKLNVENR